MIPYDLFGSDTIFASSPMIIWLIDPDRLQVNQSRFSYYGGVW